MPVCYNKSFNKWKGAETNRSKDDKNHPRKSIIAIVLYNSWEAIRISA
jgi:hypothetical protein